jgi:hypothetical protein
MELDYLPTSWDYLENYFRGQFLGTVNIPAPWILWGY